MLDVWEGKRRLQSYGTELSMGPFFLWPDPTQPTTVQVEKFGPNPTQVTMELQFSSDVFLYTELISHF